jgi:hypothetical protein
MHRWGDTDYVRDLFAPLAVTFRFEHNTLTVEFASVDDFEATFLNNGPIVSARAALESAHHRPSYARSTPQWV